MRYLRLLPHIGFAMVDNRAVFLDLRRDRYFALEGAAAAAFDSIRSSPDGLADDQLAASLLATGIFASAMEPCDCLAARAPAPRRDLGHDMATPGLKDLVQVLLLVIRCRHELRSRPLEEVIAKRRQGGSECTASKARGETLLLAQRFQRARALIPIKPICLQDSLALHDWLVARGATCFLVLGVRLDPFAAHCWVQLDETVLNDASDKVMQYTPILVIQ